MSSVTGKNLQLQLQLHLNLETAAEQLARCLDKSSIQNLQSISTRQTNPFLTGYYS